MQQWVVVALFGVVACGSKDERPAAPNEAPAPAKPAPTSDTPAAGSGSGSGAGSGSGSNMPPWHAFSAMRSGHPSPQAWTKDTPCVGFFVLDLTWESAGCGDALERWAYEGFVENGSLGVQMDLTDDTQLVARAEESGRCKLRLVATTPRERFEVELQIAEAKVEGRGTYKLQEPKRCESSFTINGREHVPSDPRKPRSYE
ncbi:MAG: hypothetical protein AB7O24_06280 [Kofleriaceae bacterium]